nr:UvrD-helicase domain-containing protein [Arenimonas malthae]
MVDPAELLRQGNSSVVAPAGHGKTEVIAKAAALGNRTLVLTHTHAGVHAIRARLKRLGVPTARAAVETVASWSTRYAYAFPGVAQPPPGDPQSGAEWDQLYAGSRAALDVSAIRDVVGSSYDRVLVDEYQDCNSLQHELTIALSTIVPTTVFGDPMQGIFEFAGATLDWDRDIFPTFPLFGSLDQPYRWKDKNPDLGAWVAETRLKLLRGEPIDLIDPRICYRPSTDAFDMGVLFDGIDAKEGSFAAIHCNKGICYKLASAANGGYQAIEEVAANRLRIFARAWDAAPDVKSKANAIVELSKDCFHKRTTAETEAEAAEVLVVREGLNIAYEGMNDGNGAEAAIPFMALLRKRPLYKLYRGGLWRDCEHAVGELAAGRAETMVAAAERIKQRVHNTGRKLPGRTVSTPLLLKGLEFDHVVIPDATHFGRERQARAKLFYVAISRATRSLTIGSSSRFLTF